MGCAWVFRCGGRHSLGRVGWSSSRQCRADCSSSRCKWSVAASCSISTSACYLCCIKQFCEFCKKHGRNWSSPNNADMILYLQCLKNRGLSFSTLLQQVSAISQFYLLADKPDPTQHKLVSAIVSAVKHLPREVRWAFPAMLMHIQLIAARAKECSGFAELRVFIMSF